jgi:HNH endonuclease
MPLISADHIERDDGERLDILLIDWRRGGEWYVTACLPANRGAIAELWREEDYTGSKGLSWRYKPSKRGGRNSERLEYFRRAVGDLTMHLTIPAADDPTDRFLDDIFDLVETRIRADDLNPDEPEPRLAFPEGQAFERQHLARERSSALIRHVKNQARRAGAFHCEVCGFDFEAVYGAVGHGFIEAHHTVPISELEPGATTRPEDIALVCANCHRMLHRRRPWLLKHQLRQLLGPRSRRVTTV